MNIIDKIQKKKKDKKFNSIKNGFNFVLLNNRSIKLNNDEVVKRQ